MADGHYYSLPRKAVTLLRWCAVIIIRTQALVREGRRGCRAAGRADRGRKGPGGAAGRILTPSRVTWKVIGSFQGHSGELLVVSNRHTGKLLADSNRPAGRRW